MSNTEETPESCVKRGSFVNDFLEMSGRKKARSSHSTDNQHIGDLEYMDILKSVRILVKIINEVWDKCEKHLIASKSNNSPFTFQRRLFEEVKVEKKGRSLKITTQKVSDTKDFGSPPDVPEDLSKLVCFDPPKSKSNVLPDYKKYLQKSSILCKDVLLPFLTSFQKHLKEIQVFLGKIEEWLIEPEAVVSFLNKTFNGPGCLRLERKNDPSKIYLYCSFCLDVDFRIESTYNLCTEKGREGLKAALAFVKTLKPIPQIEVKDAGEKAVNGMYTLTGVHGGNYFYTRSGVWDGKRMTFYLVRHQNRKRWFMKYIYASKYVKSFYWAEGTPGEKHELPPMNGWNMEGNNFHGVNPPPQILYKIDD